MFYAIIGLRFYFFHKIPSRASYPVSLEAEVQQQKLETESSHEHPRFSDNLADRISPPRSWIPVSVENAPGIAS